MSDLSLKLEGTVVETRIAQLQKELSDRGLNFPLHFYLSDEWFTPDGQASMAVPFYLAHPRLERLEKAQMLAVEGGEHEWCMRILRHEAGHVIDNAYKLRLRAAAPPPVRQLVEAVSRVLRIRGPTARASCMHLDPWYAQSHPDEDFAETFAVWLTPESNWKTRYAGWPAIKKLEYMDALMQSLVGKKPLLNHTEEVDPLRRLQSQPAVSLQEEAPPPRRRSPELLRSRPAKAVLRRARARRQHDRGAVPRPRTAARCARWWPTGPASTNTPSTRCSKTSSSAAAS